MYDVRFLVLHAEANWIDVPPYCMSTLKHFCERLLTYFDTRTKGTVPSQQIISAKCLNGCIEMGKKASWDQFGGWLHRVLSGLYTAWKSVEENCDTTETFTECKD